MNQKDKIRKIVREYCIKNNMARISNKEVVSAVFARMGSKMPHKNAIVVHLKGKEFKYDSKKREFGFRGQLDEDNALGGD